MGGVLGDEPAGVESILEFFRQHSKKYEKHFEFTAFPCVNPWGFEHFKRENGFGLNINREFKTESPSEEVCLILRHLKKRYAVAVDFHEDMKVWTRIGTNEPDGECPEKFFFWETCTNKMDRIGRRIIDNVTAAGYPVCGSPMIYGDRNNGGVIWYPDDAISPCYSVCDSSDTFLIREGYTDHAFTVETPRDQDMSDRVTMNLITLRAILEEKLRTP